MCVCVDVEGVFVCLCEGMCVGVLYLRCIGCLYVIIQF